MLSVSFINNITYCLFLVILFYLCPFNILCSFFLLILSYSFYHFLFADLSPFILFYLFTIYILYYFIFFLYTYYTMLSVAFTHIIPCYLWPVHIIYHVICGLYT